MRLIASLLAKLLNRVGIFCLICSESLRPAKIIKDLKMYYFPKSEMENLFYYNNAYYWFTDNGWSKWEVSK